MTWDFAGFWIRAGAFVVDSLVLWLPMTIVTRTIEGFMAGMVDGDRLREGQLGPAIGMIVLTYALVLAIYTAYFAVFHSSRWQATLGKRLLNIHVVNVDGTRLSLAQGILRYLASGISGILLCIGYMMAGFTDQKTALHDRMCHTRVVFGRV